MDGFVLFFSKWLSDWKIFLFFLLGFWGVSRAQNKLLLAPASSCAAQLSRFLSPICCFTLAFLYITDPYGSQPSLAKLFLQRSDIRQIINLRCDPSLSVQHCCRFPHSSSSSCWILSSGHSSTQWGMLQIQVCGFCLHTWWIGLYFFIPGPFYLIPLDSILLWSAPGSILITLSFFFA